MNSILLSISILSNGKSKDLKKTINSLDLLRNNVPSELVMVDTGCDKDTREYLESVADKVIDFTWCDDFAAARNAGLNECSGEWFMFMDDDEYFENTDEIEKFFTSGEYVKYNSLQYIVRNYLTYSGDEWDDVNLIRLTKIYPNTVFRYPIHESLYPINNPCKVTYTYAHHYGYVKDDIKKRDAKNKRNMDILLPYVKKHPESINHIIQLLLVYWEREDYKQAIIWSDIAIANKEKHKINAGNILNIAYTIPVIGCNYLHNYDEAITRANNVLDFGKISDLCKAAIYSELCVSYGNKYEYRKSIDCYNRYLDYQRWFEKNKNEFMLQSLPVLSKTYSELRYAYITGWALYSAILSSDTDTAESIINSETIDWWLDNIGTWYSLVSDEFRSDWQNAFSELVNRVDESSPLTKLYSVLTTSDEKNPDSASDELLMLANQLKSKIHDLISEGQKEAALVTIDQLLTFLPDDTELIELKKSIDNR